MVQTVAPAGDRAGRPLAALAPTTGPPCHLRKWLRSTHTSDAATRRTTYRGHPRPSARHDPGRRHQPTHSQSLSTPPADPPSEISRRSTAGGGEGSPRGDHLGRTPPGLPRNPQDRKGTPKGTPPLHPWRTRRRATPTRPRRSPHRHPRAQQRQPNKPKHCQHNIREVEF